MKGQHDNPYVGPRTFEERDREYFFGREAEAQQLRALVLAQRQVLFYAMSGAGKSSLVNTRLIPALRSEGFTPLRGRVSFGQDPSKRLEVSNVFVFNLLSNLSPDVDPSKLATLTLAEYLSQYHQLPPTHPDTAVEPARVLIVDQFEELFTTNQEHWEQRERFFRQLAEALSKDRLLWVLLVMREDYITGLERYAYLMPDKLRVRYHMERMRGGAALEAIKAPAEKAGRPFEPNAAETLLQDLQQVRVVGSEGTIAGEFVEPVQLQLVCYSLWESLSAKPGASISTNNIEAVADVDKTLGEYYDSAIEAAVSQTGVEEQVLRDLFGEHFITETDTRGLVFRGDTQTKGVDNAVIDILDEQFFLLRSSTIGGGKWYELVHDRFVPAVRQSNERARIGLESRRLQAHVEAQRKEEAAKWRKRILVFIVPAAVILTIAAIVLLVWQNSNLQQANAQARMALEGEIAAGEAAVANLRTAEAANTLAAEDAATAAALATERSALLEQQRLSLVEQATRLAQAQATQTALPPRLRDNESAEAEAVVAANLAVQIALVEATQTSVALEQEEASARATQAAAAQPSSEIIGYSVGGQPIAVGRYGSGPHKIVLVGGIHAGASPNSIELTRTTAQWLADNPEGLPASVTVIVLENLNPDSEYAPGKLEGRYNANGVDLNRNWDCEWKADPAIQGVRRQGAGGDAPFSEPETHALAQFLEGEKPELVIFWGAQAAGGMVIPGGCPSIDESTEQLTRAFSESAGYAYEAELFSSTEGDATNWLALQGIPSFFVLLPDVWSVHWVENLEGLMAVIELIARE